MPQPRLRQRVSQACEPCGRRKIKCDGQLPLCSQCKDAAKECTWAVSKRNKRQNLLRGIAQHVHTPPDSASNLPVESTPTSNASGASQCSTSADVVISPEASARLFKAYLSQIHPVWPILYTPMYDFTSANHSSGLPAPILHSIYAIAACIEQARPDIPSPSLFFEAALTALQRRDGTTSPTNRSQAMNFVRPSLTSCQALTILALQQHGLAEASSAFMLCNVASAMAIELRLNEAASVATLSAVDAQQAARVWWNLYTLDKLLACELDRPVLLRHEDTDAPYPSIEESDEYQLLQVNGIGPQAVSIKAHTLSAFHLTIHIIRVMENVTREIYSVSSKNIICADFAAAEIRRFKLWDDIKQYSAAASRSHLALDDVGQVPKAVTPVAIINRIWTSTIEILLHRPFHFYWIEHDWAPRHTMAVPSSPVYICLGAARDICRVMSTYSENLTRFPCDVIFPIVMAAATIWQCGNLEGMTTEQQGEIDLCVKWLSIINKSWKNAGESREKLIRDIGSPAQLRSEAFHGRAGLVYPTADTAMADQTSLDHDPMWAFLDVLGDRVDEFGSADISFRGFMEAQFGRLAGNDSTI